MAICITDVETMLTVDERVVATARALVPRQATFALPPGRTAGCQAGHRCP